ncbi:phospholipase A(1) LCAT3-like isoform X2 [Vicia villosa]|uniref:phospholipase A(1) LCAT3-like isoform X2 n=1 Tax=Vicia villosa TaxID=3911 RepID=UPI00273A93E1|nr:phospholipase A(1) LCAT3-like isoform X2 [Vicia villosa]
MGFCPCFGVETSEQPPLADRDPVLLISGMGGSILQSKPKKFGLTTRVWVRIFLADLEFRKKIWSIYNPETGYTEALDTKSELVVPEDDHGLYAIDILDPSWFVKCVHLTEVYHFHDMIDMLVGCGYVKGTTLFGYGYDFRQSNRMDKLMDGLKLKLETAYKASGGRKVNIISHSMGGVMILCFMSLCRDAFSKYVNKWIALACPFQGAPGCINDSLLTGLEFVEGLKSYFFVSRWTFHQLLKYNGKLIPLPFNTTIFKWATGTRQVISNAKLPNGVCFYNIYGTSFETPFDVCYGSEKSPIEDLSEICKTLPQYSYVDGDGSVPVESAKADGLEAVERVGVTADHRGLLRDKTVFKLIQKWLDIEPVVSKHSKTSKVADANTINPMVL